VIPTAIVAGAILGWWLWWWAVPIVAMAWRVVVAVWVDSPNVTGAIALGAANAVAGTLIVVLLKRLATLRAA
jgi:hypothetical protein